MAIVITTKEVTGILSKQATSGAIITASLVETDTFLPLTDRLIKNKFQLYNRSRQKIVSNIKSETHLTPFQMFTDSKQGGKKFVLGGFQYKPCSDMYSIELYEYDNTTIINIKK